MRTSLHCYARSMLLVGTTLCTLPSFAQGVSISSGAHLVVNGNANLQLHDAGFKNDGTFVPSSGKVNISGSSVSSPTLGGTTTSSFNEVKIDRTGGPLTLGQNIAVTGSVTMVHGNVELNNKVLDLGTTGQLLGEQENSRITGVAGGYIRAVANLNAPVAANPGNIGIEINSPANLGVTEVRRAHKPFDVSTLDESINRYFNIVPTNNNNLHAAVKFHYFDAELNIANESDLQVWSSTDNGMDWTLYGINTLDIVNNYAIRGGLDTLNHITLSTNIINAIPLRLTLLSFNAKAEDKQVSLDWETTNEIATSHFDVERSISGISFEKIGTVTASGNTSAPESYHYTDNNPYLGTSYYRLRMADKDGKYSYSRIAAVNRNIALHSEVLSVFPVPAESSVNIRLSSAHAFTAAVNVFSASGSLMAQHVFDLKQGEQVINIPTEKLAQGAYYVRFNENGLNNIRFIKK